MPDHLGDDMRKVKDDKEEPEKEIKCWYRKHKIILTCIIYSFLTPI
jgi:hypothetical protein